MRRVLNFHFYSDEDPQYALTQNECVLTYELTRVFYVLYEI
jgi:hypothetical protein